MPQAPGVSDCIELNELKMEQPGESLETKVLCETHPDRRGSSEVWRVNVKGDEPEDASAGMERGNSRNGFSEETG